MQIEVMLGVLQKADYGMGPDFFESMDAASEVLEPMLTGDTMPEIDNSSLTLGYAGVYSSFLRHADRASEKFDVDPRELLIELGER